MSRVRVLLVRDGDFFIHVQQLAELLVQGGHDVEVLHTGNGEPEPLYRSLIDETRRLGVVCHLVHERAPWLEDKLVAAAYQAGVTTKRGVVTPFKVRRARQLLSTGAPFDVVIAIDAPSLYLACRLFPQRLNQILEYSLEVSDESHGDFQASRAERAFRYFERAMLPRIGGLIIQDRFRAEVLLQHIPEAAQIATCFFPVAVNGPAVAGDRPHPQSPARVLFFGGLWSDQLLGEFERVSRRLRDGQVLAICGGRGTVQRPPTATDRLEISTTPIPFDRINEMIATADIGLAVYPQAEANSRRSAFAGEKVARYLQCGVPFIAFESVDYAFLQAETGCCELVRTYDEIPAAVNTILDNYPRYHRGARVAFERYYWRETTGPILLRFIEARYSRS